MRPLKQLARSSRSLEDLSCRTLANLSWLVSNSYFNREMHVRGPSPRLILQLKWPCTGELNCIRPLSSSPPNHGWSNSKSVGANMVWGRGKLDRGRKRQIPHRAPSSFFQKVAFQWLSQLKKKIFTHPINPPSPPPYFYSQNFFQISLFLIDLLVTNW